MANMPTRFSGPALYSGQGTDNKFFENMPLGLNPDYLVLMEDFLGDTINSTLWDIENSLSGTATMMGASGPGVPGDDVVGGWALLSGSSTTANSGSSLQSNEQLQGISDIFFETRVGLQDAANSDLYAGLSIAGALTTIHPFHTNPRVGFFVDATTGSGEIQCITSSHGGSAIKQTSTGISFEDYSLGADGGQVKNSKVLGLKWWNGNGVAVTDTGGSFFPYVVEFFVDRKLVATHRNISFANRSISTSVFSPMVAFIQGSGLSAVSTAVVDYLFFAQARHQTPTAGIMSVQS